MDGNFVAEASIRRILWALILGDLESCSRPVALTGGNPDVGIPAPFKRLLEAPPRDNAALFPPGRHTANSLKRLRTSAALSRAAGNAIAERWVGTFCRECLDQILILGRKHLERVLRIYVPHYNRPYRSLDQQAPTASPPAPIDPRDVINVRRRDRLGGLLHEYELAA